METLTVACLMRICQQAIRDGYGNHKILVSNDDEANGYHELCHGIIGIDDKDVEIFHDFNVSLPDGLTDEELKNYVTLG